MNKRTVFCAALLSALATPALADGWQFVGGEAVWGYSGLTRGDTTRQQIQPARKDLESNAVTADGWKQVDGEAVWAYVGPPNRSTPEQVARARGNSERNAVSADGWKQIDGEAGWLFVGTQTERRSTMGASSAIR